MPSSSGWKPSKVSRPVEVQVVLRFEINPAGPHLKDLRSLYRAKQRDEFTKKVREIAHTFAFPVPGINMISWENESLSAMVLRWRFDSLDLSKALSLQCHTKAGAMDRDSALKRACGISSASSRIVDVTSNLLLPSPQPPAKVSQAPEVTYKTQIPERPSYTPLPTTSSFSWVDWHSTPLEHYEPPVRRYILMMNDAVKQLKAVYAQLHVAEAHIISMTTRDGALVSRTREAEQMVRQAHIRAEKNDAVTQKLEEALKTTEIRAQRSEQRAFAAQESLANLNRHLEFLIGQENKWRYKQLEESPDITSQEAHLQVLQAILSDSAATEAKSPDTVQVPLEDDTALLEAEARIADLTRQLSESNAATARERANSRSLASISSTSRAEADSALAETKQRLHDANTKASAAQARTIELQTELCRVNDQLSQSDSQLRHVEERATEIEAQARDGQKALTAAVLQGVRVEAERRAVQLSLDTIRAERESPFIVPDLMDALRMIAQRS